MPKSPEATRQKIKKKRSKVKITSWVKNKIKNLFQREVVKEVVKEIEVVKEVEPRPTGGLWTEGFGAVGATLKTLEELGVKSEHLKRIRSDKFYAGHVAKNMLTAPANAPISLELAREIMGPNYWGPEDWEKEFGISFSPREFEEIKFLNISEKDLWERRHTHFLFVGLSHDAQGTPITLRRWQEILPALRFPYGEKELSGINITPTFQERDGKEWTELTKERITDSPFYAEHTLQLRWYLVRRDSLLNTRDSSYEYQMRKLSPEEKVASPIEFVTATILSLLNRRSAPIFQLRTCQWIDTPFAGELVVATEGKNISLLAKCPRYKRADEVCDPELGIATAWKF